MQTDTQQHKADASQPGPVSSESSVVVVQRMSGLVHQVYITDVEPRDQ